MKQKYCRQCGIITFVKMSILKRSVSYSSAGHHVADKPYRIHVHDHSFKKNVYLDYVCNSHTLITEPLLKDNTTSCKIVLM
jgi:hypothetical protein